MPPSPCFSGLCAVNATAILWLTAARDALSAARLQAACFLICYNPNKNIIKCRKDIQEAVLITTKGQEGIQGVSVEGVEGVA